MHVNQFSLLKTKRFLPIFITQFLGAFNDNVFKNALVIMITYRISEAAGMNAQILVSLAAGVFILPFFLFSATAGQWADKIEKAKLIRIIKFAEIILMLGAVVGFFLQSVPLLLLILFLLGSQASFFGPVKYAVLPFLLNENELIAGNGLIEAGTFLSILLGTIFGGLLILSPIGIYLISAAVLLLAIGGFVASLYIPATGSANPGLVINYNFLSETIRVLKYSRARWDIYLSILGISWFWLLGAVFLSEFPVFAKDTLYANEYVVTWFIAIFALGIGLGSLLCNRLLKGRVHATYVPLATIGMTIFALDMYFAAHYVSVIPVTRLASLGRFLHTFSGWRISIDLLLLAVCGGLYTVPLYATLQTRSHPMHRARVIASNNVMNALFMVIASIATILLLKAGLTVNEVFLTLALTNAAVAVYICKLLPEMLLKALLRMILTAIYRVKIIGLDNYYNAGKRVVIIANHTSFLDAALFAAFLPDKFIFAVDLQTSKKWWVSFFLRLVDAYPVDPSNPMAIKSLISHVRKNRKCVIFPEGRITVTGALMKIYEGPGMIADKANAVLLPVCIQGAQFSHFSRMKGKMPIRIAPQIKLTIFPAQKLDLPADVKGRKRRYRIGSKLYDIMTQIVFESCNYDRTLFAALIDSKSIHGRYYNIVSDTDFLPVTYQDLLVRSFILGKYIANETERSEYVGVLLPTTATTVATFFALQAYLRVPAMLNFSAGIKNVLLACESAKIKRVYTAKKFITIANLSNMVASLEQAGITVVYLEDVRQKITWLAKIAGTIKSHFPSIAYYRINKFTRLTEPAIADLPAVVLFTSGSEGTPKGVVLSHRNLQANRYQLAACIDFTELDKVFNALPMFHSFGLTGGMLLPVFSGIHTFLYPSPLHYRVVPQLVYSLNATILFGTDTFLSGYAKHAHPYDFYSLRYVFSGAEKLRIETLTVWTHKFGVRIFDGYGATETSPVIATNTPMQYRTGTVGRILPGISYQISAVPGIETGGVLQVSGPNVMKGYLLAKSPGIILPPPDGWYDTGDIVSVDDDGFLTIEGRVKRFAKIGGEMVSLSMVELYINALWPDYQHAVVNMPDTRKGEQLVLVTTHAEANREELVKYARGEQVGELSIPKKIIVLPKMPLLGSGKIDYTQIKELLNNLAS